MEYKAKFDDRLRFRDYFAYTESGDGKIQRFRAHDAGVPRNRQIIFEAEEASAETIFTSASWRMIKIMLEAYSFSLPVTVPPAQF
jgi:hypothetical protein